VVLPFVPVIVIIFLPEAHFFMMSGQIVNATLPGMVVAPRPIRRSIHCVILAAAFAGALSPILNMSYYHKSHLARIRVYAGNERDLPRIRKSASDILHHFFSRYYAKIIYDISILMPAKISNVDDITYLDFLESVEDGTVFSHMVTHDRTVSRASRRNGINIMTDAVTK
jgi:hypothetical protein